MNKYEALLQEYEIQVCDKVCNAYILKGATDHSSLLMYSIEQNNFEQEQFVLVEQLKAKIDAQKEEVERLTENTLQPKWVLPIHSRYFSRPF